MLSEYRNDAPKKIRILVENALSKSWWKISELLSSKIFMIASQRICADESPLEELEWISTENRMFEVLLHQISH